MVIRVLHCVYGMDRGGVETFIMNVYRQINREKVQFDFLLATEKEGVFHEEIRSLGGRIYYAPARRRNLIELYRRRHAFFAEHREYRIIHCHADSLSSVETLRIARRHGVGKRIIHCQSSYPDAGWFHACLHLLNRGSVKTYATHYFTCSRTAARWLYGRKIHGKDEYAIINNGIDTGPFRFDSGQRTSIRGELGLGTAFVIGHVGRFAANKNHLFLIEIFCEIVKIRPEARLLLVGDGVMRGEIEEKIARLGLTDRVVLAGMRDNTAAILCAMDVFVMPSFFEGLPLALVEAQASGLPCLVSAEGFPAEAELTAHFTYLPLGEPATVWAAAVLSLGEHQFDRADGVDAVRKAGFDMADIAGNLEKFYLEGY